MQEELRRVFLAGGRSQAERILGLGDRDPTSPTYGCFDRTYWHYKAIDFASSWFQCADRYLAALYRSSAPECAFSGNAKVRQWAWAAVDYFRRQARRSGATDEAYPGEHSFCSTCFGLGDALRTCRLLGRGGEGFERTVGFVATAPLSPASNQEAARCYALAEAVQAGYDQAATLEQAAVRLLAEHDRYGCFAEYGGYDLGYVSISCGQVLQFLDLAPECGPCDQLRQRVDVWLDRALEETDEYAVYDSSAMARRTQFIYPFAAARRGHPLVERIARGVQAGRIVQPAWLDDRYVTRLAIDYLETSEVLNAPQPG